MEESASESSDLKQRLSQSQEARQRSESDLAAEGDRLRAEASGLSQRCESLEDALSDARGELSSLQSHYDERGRENDEARAAAVEARQGWQEETRRREKK